MAKNNYGVYTESQDGTLSWVVTVSPLTMGTGEEAALFSQNDSMVLATYLNGIGEVIYRVGRPGDRQP